MVTHLGRPQGFDPNLSTEPLAVALSKLLGQRVKHIVDCIGVEVEGVVSELRAGDVLLLENIRFYEEETKNDSDFAQTLASLADLYINDAFGAAHRAHASTEGVTHYFDQCAAGLLMEREIEYLGKALDNPGRPFVAILGGAKISDKIGVIENLLDKVDQLIIGGGMAYTFLKARGLSVGTSIVELDKLDLAKELLQEASNRNLTIHLPLDHVIGREFDPKTPNLKLCPVRRSLMVGVVLISEEKLLQSLAKLLAQRKQSSGMARWGSMSLSNLRKAPLTLQNGLLNRKLSVSLEAGIVLLRCIKRVSQIG